MSESMTDRITPDESITTTTIFAVIGFGLFLGTLIVIYVGNMFSAGLSAYEAMLCKGLCWAAFALVHFVSFRGLADMLFGFIGSGRLSIGIGLCALPLPAVALAAVLGWVAPLLVTAGCWVLFGLASSSLMLSWSTIWSTVGRQGVGSFTIALQTGWSLALAAIMCIFMLFAPPAIAVGATLALTLCSLVLFRTCHLRVVGLVSPDAENEANPKAEIASSREEHDGFSGSPQVTPQVNREDRTASDHVIQPSKRLLTRAILTPLTRGISFGVIMFFVIFGYPFPLSLGLLIVGIGLAGAVITLVLRKLKHVPKVPSVERATFPVLAATLLLAPFCGSTVRIGLILVAVVALFYQFILNPDATSLRAEGAGAIYHCARENFISIAGVLVGWAAQTALAFAGLSPEAALFALSLGLVFLMVLEPAFIPYMSYVAIEQLASNLDEAEGQTTTTSGSWRQRCAVICQEFGLSPRESEVFLLLAKGRNAEHISNELFISTHTARTHIYRIYRKLEINSQQELIDLVERA